MKFVETFESFLRTEVNIDQTRLDRLETSVRAITTFISEHQAFIDMFLEVIPSGSWAYRTIIKPVKPDDEFDADILLHVEEQPGWKPKDYLEALYAAFRSNKTYAPMAELKTRCVRINYRGDFHVDVVPLLDLGPKQFITNREEPPGFGSFEPSDPAGMTEWMDSRRQLTNDQFVRSVRLAKYLRDYKDTFTCVSIILTTLLGNLVTIEARLRPELYADLPSAFVTLMTKLAASLPTTMPAVMDPAGTGDNFTDRYRADWHYPNFRARIVYYATKAKQAYEEPDAATSLGLWQGIFGKEFSPTGLRKSSELVPFHASVPATTEKYINQAPFNYGVAINPTYTASLSGRVTGGPSGQRNGFRQYTLASHGYQVPKHRSLSFQLTTNVPAPYNVYWKVKNGGEEAAALNQLRGEITPDGGSGAKTESTKYKGSHYVEAYVIKNNQVVAVGRTPVIVTS